MTDHHRPDRRWIVGLSSPLPCRAWGVTRFSGGGASALAGPDGPIPSRPPPPRCPMSRKIVSLEIDPEHEDLLPQYASFLGEMKDLAATAPDGSVLDACEEAVIANGREQQRRLLQLAAQARLDAAEKKGPR